jgi:hypothetical protein
VAFEREIAERFQRSRERLRLAVDVALRSLRTERFHRSVGTSNRSVGGIVADAFLDGAAVAVPVEADLDAGNPRRPLRGDDDALEMLDLDLRLGFTLGLANRELGDRGLEICHERSSSAVGHAGAKACAR